MGTFCVEGNEIRQDGRMIARIRRPDCDRWEDVLSRKDEHVWEWNRTIWIKKGRNSIENIEMGILLCRPADFYMIPCINYAGNFWGEGKELRCMPFLYCPDAAMLMITAFSLMRPGICSPKCRNRVWIETPYGSWA